MKNSTKIPVKILFLAWGYSIHAYRRIKIFADDSRFEVALVSNFPYTIPGVKLYPLCGANRKAARKRNGQGIAREPLFSSLRRFVSRFLVARMLRDILLFMPDINRVFRAYHEFRPDLIFLQTLIYPCYLAYVLPKETPLVVTFWNGDVLWWAKWNGIEQLFKKWLVTHGARRAVAVTVNSAAARAACLNYEVEPGRIHLIRYPGVDLERFSPGAREQARHKLGITTSKVVLCPRGFAPYVNSDIIIRAAKVVAKAFPEVLFLFLAPNGQGVLIPPYKALAAELGILDNLRWEVDVPWEDMPEYFRAADAVVSISSKDSLPNSMLEAMGCAVPVIMGDIPEISEWVIDGVNGFVVPVRDEVILSVKLLVLLQGEDPRISGWLQYNRKLVEEHFDSRVNCEAIKSLVTLETKAK